jgi:NAD(P)-dependent dehydrogenase (short-subunit alcohol dehydrogenase family)
MAARCCRWASAVVALVCALIAMRVGPGFEAWTLSSTSTPGLLARALVVRHRNRARMQAYAHSLRTGRPLAGKRVLVTGATSGLGRGIAGHLALAGASLVLPYRRAMSEAELKRAVLESVNQTLALAEAADGAVASLLCRDELEVLGIPGFDLASFDSIERTVEQLAATGVRLDALVNNAGLVSVRGSPTAEGFEATFGVNFLGTVHWTQLLRERGVLGPGSRVVMVGSEEHRQHSIEAPARPTHLGVQLTPASWLNSMDRYGRSKLLLNAYAHELSRRWAHGHGIAVYDVCPGPVASEIARDAPPLVAAAVSAMLRATFPSAAEAALPVVALAVDPAFALDTGASVHHHMSEPRVAGGGASGEEAGAWVWAQAQQLIGIARARRAPKAAASGR